MKRRRVVVALAVWATLLAASEPTQAQALTAMGSVGVFSFLGDSVQVVWPEDKPGASRVEARGNESLEFKGIGFDLIALRSSREVLQRVLPSTQVSLFQSPTAMSPTEQRALADGAARSQLPAWMVKTLEENKLTHVLLVTRHRGTIDARTGEGTTIGRGMVEGIGFYIDTLYSMQNSTTGAVSTGLLAPYTQIRLTLMDATSGDILNTYDVRESFAYASRDTKTTATPWTFMPAEEKVRTLRTMVEVGIKRGVQALLKK